MMAAVAKSRDPEVEAVQIRANAREERARINLERFIEASGYSVTQVADLAGIPQASLARYIKGINAIPGDALVALRDVLGRASLDDFYDPNPKPQRTAEELAMMDPLLAKSRPGFEPSEEDLADFQEYVRKVQARREKKKPKSSR